jgi:putative flavoprotein involved in K+ transport
LVGRPDHSSLDLAVLHERGVRLVGRVGHIDGHRVSLAEDLLVTTAAADIKMAEILARIDRFISATGIAAAAPEPFSPTWTLAANAPDRLDLKDEHIRTVIWATGYRRVTWPWVSSTLVAITPQRESEAGPCLGLNFQRRRNPASSVGSVTRRRLQSREVARGRRQCS